MKISTHCSTRRQKSYTPKEMTVELTKRGLDWKKVELTKRGLDWKKEEIHG